MYVTSNIGAVLRKTREFQLYSVTEAAEFAGIAPAQLIDIEVGGRNVKNRYWLNSVICTTLQAGEKICLQLPKLCCLMAIKSRCGVARSM